MDTLQKIIYIFIQATANHTDGLIVWRLDNQRYDMDSGIYAEKRTSNADAPFVSMYPSHTPATENWYQQWNLFPSCQLGRISKFNY